MSKGVLMQRLPGQRNLVLAVSTALLVAALAAAALVGGGSAREAAPQLRPAAALPLAAATASSSSTRTSAPARARAARAYGRLPLGFEPAAAAAGQGRFLSRGNGATVLLGAREASFSLAAGKPSGRRALLRMRLEGASPQARLTASKRLPGVVNELLGNDPSRWRTNIPTFARLQADEVYPGIDLAFHGRQGSLEYDFLLAPGADPSRIALGFRGQRSLRLDRAGNLLLPLPGGTLHQARPRAFQAGRPVPARFVLRQGSVGFALGRYDRSRPLLIDPTLAYSSYLGGSGSDRGRAIAVDAAGSAYLTGYTNSTNFPTASPLQAANGGGFDAFVSKLNPSGSALVYSSYLGGSSDDLGLGIAVDSGGSAYLTGQTNSTNFPTANALQATNAGGADAFVSKLNPSGSALVYSSYLGGSGVDYGFGIAVDSAGSTYLTGYTNSTNFPTASPLQAANGGGFDAFVSKLNPSGSALVYSSYLGGSGGDFGYGIAVDSLESAYLTGQTNSTNFPTANALQATNAGGADAFVSKLNPAGSALVYSSYLGGSQDDVGNGIAVDAAGSAYLTGYTTSTNFPTANPLQAANAGFSDVFVSKLNPSGSALVYSSYLGGSGDDRGYGIAVDSLGSAYLSGDTGSINFPTANPLQAANAGSSDAFVSKLNPAGSALVYSSYLGGSGVDLGYGIAVDSAGSAYLSGHTGSINFPTASPLQAASAGGGDAFVAKIQADPTAVAFRSFAASRSGRGVLLRWRTGSEAGLLGFHLYRQADGVRARVNRALLAARGGAAGRAYSFRDRLPRGTGQVRYWLQELRLDGSRVLRGPVRSG